MFLRKTSTNIYGKTSKKWIPNEKRKRNENKNQHQNKTQRHTENKAQNNRIKRISMACKECIFWCSAANAENFFQKQKEENDTKKTLIDLRLCGTLKTEAASPAIRPSIHPSIQTVSGCIACNKWLFSWEVGVWLVREVRSAWFSMLVHIRFIFEMQRRKGRKTKVFRSFTYLLMGRFL